MALKPEHIAQLEALINQAEVNGETPDFIHNELIPQFKAKYDTQNAPVGNKQVSPAQPATGFKAEYNNAIEDARAGIKQAATDYTQGNISWPEGAIRSTGEVAKAASAIPIAAIKRIIPSMPDRTPTVRPGMVDTRLFLKKGNLTPSNMAELASTYPRAAKDLSAIGNIGAFALGTGIGGKVATKAAALSDIGKVAKTPTIQELRQIKKFPESVKKPRVFSGIDKGDAVVLSVPKSELSEPFTVYAKQAEKAKNIVDPITGEAVETPIDLVAKKGPVAHDVLLKQKGEIGAIKDNAMKTIDDAVVNTNDFVNSKNIKDVFNSNLEKYAGAYIDEAGKIKPSSSGFKAKAYLPELNGIKNIINDIPEEMTISQLDALSANLRSFLTKRTRGELAPKRDIVDGIVDNLRSGINKQIEEKANKLLSPSDYKKYIDAKKEYAVLSDLTDETSKIFGREVVPGSDITSRGASIVKRAVQSNTDAGSKALFNEIKRRTGIDFIQEGNYAVLAMKAAGDPRARNLLEDSGLLVGVATGGAKGIALDALRKVSQKTIQGNKLENLVKYYEKAQNKGRKLSEVGRE